MTKAKEDSACPVEAVIDVIAGKWKAQILWRLWMQPMRFAEPRKEVG